MDSVSIDVKPPCDTKKADGSCKTSAEQKNEKSELARDVTHKAHSGQSKDSACEHRDNSEACGDNSLLSLIMGHLKNYLLFTFENIASKPGGQIVLRTVDSGLLVAESVSFWIQDSSSLRCVPWLVMLPFLISARVANFCLSSTERITGLHMPTQSRVINAIRTLRNDIWVIRKMGMKKMEIDKQDKEMSDKTGFLEHLCFSWPITIVEWIQSLAGIPDLENDNETTITQDKSVHLEKNTNSEEEEGACALLEDTYSQMSDQAYQYSSTLEGSSDCDSELGQKIESMLSTISTTLDDSYSSF